MSASHFLDTNIFVYSLDRQDPEKARIALDLIRSHSVHRTGVISFQVVQEFFSAVSRKAPEMLTSGAATNYLVTVLGPLLRIHSSIDLYSSALSLRTRYQLSWYDSLIVAAALESRCSTLLSEDLQHGMKIGDLRIENPFLK